MPNTRFTLAQPTPSTQAIPRTITVIYLKKNYFEWFRIVSGLYDVQLDETRPQFGLEEEEKNRLLSVLFITICVE